VFAVVRVVLPGPHVPHPCAIARSGRRLRRPGLDIGAAVVIVASLGVRASFVLGT